MPNQNGRTQNDNTRGENRSWRPQDDDRTMRDRDRDQDDRTERYGGGQSGYGSGRWGDDRSMGAGYRNQAYGDRQYDDRQGMHTDDRFTGRGGEGYWEDRSERTGYNSGYNQGGMGYGQQGGGMQRDRGDQRQAFRGGSAGAQYGDDNRRYPDMYGPDDYRGQGSQQGYGTSSRWANVPQAGMSTDWGRMQDDYGRGYGGGMQGNYGGSSTGYGGSGSYGMRQGQYGQGQYGQGPYGQGPYGQQGMRGGNIGQGFGGGHRGKGPQGYTRSDERIKEQVSEALSDDDQIDATHIEVVVKNGEVILTGTVEDRRQKRLAEDCIEHLPGVRDVQNQLRCGTNNRGNQSSGSAVGRNETEMSSDKKHRA